jgi:hypothetical protein
MLGLTHRDKGDGEMPLDLESIYEDLGEFDGVVANLSALRKSCEPVNPMALAPIMARIETLVQTIKDALPSQETVAG